MPFDLAKDSLLEFEKNLIELIKKRPEAISFDCMKLEHVTSSHIGFLMQAYQRCTDAGIKVHLISPSRGLVQVLRVLDLYDFFSYGQSLDFERAVSVSRKDFSDIYADEFKTNSESINEATSNFMDFLASFHLPQMIEFELRTIFYEVATNIQTHANIGENESIVFTAKTDDSKINLVFADSGTPFDLTKKYNGIKPEISAKNKQKRGYGLILINKLTNKITYVRENDAINVLILEKEWRQ
jgi:anti-sigma regulatory factor (Ser/Thr protein kinase)/anti-anti-sigma regulatory factor